MVLSAQLCKAFESHDSHVIIVQHGKVAVCEFDFNNIGLDNVKVVHVFHDMLRNFVECHLNGVFSKQNP